MTDIQTGLLSAADVRSLVARQKSALLAEDARKRKVAEEELKHQKEMFLHGTVTPDFIAHLTSRIGNAAANGEMQLLLGRFPSAWCTDGGRAINARETDWPATLQGFARDFYDFWERELKPRGFQMEVAIIDFPGGMPGDVGATLSWQEGSGV
ncbi:hypothetical protein [Azospirillum sp. B510]|uniref:hypothetical protein n=1 Tax=Azospirillum sp. (strain B510) TaxID=137722 RepID=UPI000310FB74|nr:hypothetical protein [Azospirillum sp. B510]